MVRTRVISAEEARRDRLERDSMVQWAGICTWVDVDEREERKKDSLQSEQCCPSLRRTFVYLLATRNPYSVFSPLKSDCSSPLHIVNTQ